MKSTVSSTVGNYKLYNEIGRGAFGRVYYGTDKDGKGSFAVKVIPFKAINDPKKNQMLNRELTISQQVSDPHLVKLVQALQTDDNVYMIFELCQCGSLEKYMAAHSYLWCNENFAIRVIKDLLLGYRTLFNNNIAHRDIKLGNIFVAINENKEICFKLGDYGFAKIFGDQEELQTEMTNTLVGTTQYMSPEILNGEKYSIASDIFSIGIVFYVILFGKLPFPFNKQVDLYNAFSKGLIPLDMSNKWITEDSLDFLQRCLQLNPTKRLKMEVALNHSIFSRSFLNGGPESLSIK